MTRYLPYAVAFATLVSCVDDDYDTVRIDGPGAVIIDPAAPTTRSLTIACGPNAESDGVLATTSVDGVLTLDTDRDDCTFTVHGDVRRIESVRPSTWVDIQLAQDSYLTQVSGDTVNLFASGPAEVDLLVAQSATVEGDNTSSLLIRDIDVDALYVNGAGNGEFFLQSIEAERWDLMLRGNAFLRADGVVGHTVLDLRGNVTVDAVDVLTNRVSGSAGGNATVTLTVSGPNDLDVFGSADVTVN